MWGIYAFLEGYAQIITILQIKNNITGGRGSSQFITMLHGGEEESLGTPKFYYVINGQGNLIMKDHVPIGKFYTWLNCFKYATFFFLVILEVLVMRNFKTVGGNWRGMEQMFLRCQHGQNWKSAGNTVNPRYRNVNPELESQNKKLKYESKTVKFCLTDFFRGGGGSTPEIHHMFSAKKYCKEGK